MEKLKIKKFKNLNRIVVFRSILKKLFPELKEKLKKEYLKEKIKGKEGMFLEAQIQNEIIGFSLWFKETQDLAYLWWLLVLPKWQNNGYGKIILRETLNEIQKKGFKRVWAKIKNDNFAILSLLAKFHFCIKGLSQENGIFTVIVEKDLQKE